MKIIVINGPNLNMTGIREKSVYGTGTLEDINKKIAAKCEKDGIDCDFFQSNSEGALIDKIHSWGWAIAYVVISSFEIVLAYDCFTYMKIPFTFIGVVAMFSMYNLLVEKTFSLKKHHYLTIACSFTFFIYLFHEPTLNIVRKLLIVILGRTSLGFAINYLVSPWIFAIGFIFVGNLLKKYTPRLFSICVGGR